MTRREQFGGTATFAFDQDVNIGSVKWIDKDHVQITS
jgi:hypothetical protein